jgi:hypothetical protein
MNHLTLCPTTPPTPTASGLGTSTSPIPPVLNMYHRTATNTQGMHPYDVIVHGIHSSSTARGLDTRAAARRRRSWPECPNTTHYRLNRATGQLIKAYCNRLTCPSCVVPRAIGVGQAIALAEPTQLVTITQLGTDWPTIHTSMRKFTNRLRRIGTSGHWAYHVEPFQSGANTHAHLWWRGTDLWPEEIAHGTRAAGIGWHHDIRPTHVALEQYRVPTLEYGLKMILRDRPDNPTTLWPTAEQYLALNGGRLVHTSRGFWRDRHGTPTTLAKAQVSARAHRPHQWSAVAA